MLNLDT